MKKSKLLYPVLLGVALLLTSCTKKDENFTCRCITTINNNLGTFLTENEIQVNGPKGEGAATCAKQNKSTNDGNGNSENIQCALK